MRDRRANALAGDRVGHLAQRNVRRHARRPQGARDVELADEARDAEFFLQVAELVLLREAAQAHRVLVERREHDAVDFAALGGIGRRFERGQRGATAGLRRLARRDGLGGDEIERRERGAARLEPERHPAGSAACRPASRRHARLPPAWPDRCRRRRRLLRAFRGARGASRRSRDRCRWGRPAARRGAAGGWHGGGTACALSRHGCSPS